MPVVGWPAGLSKMTGAAPAAKELYAAMCTVLIEGAKADSTVENMT